MTNLKLTVFVFVLIAIKTTTTANTAIPFQLAGKLIIVRATVDGQAGNFILDTGVADLVLNARYFEGEPTGRIFHGVNGQSGSLAISNPSLQIGDQCWKSVYAEVIPMIQLESSKGIPVHGMLGANLFRKYTLLIDLQKLEIELFPVGKRGAQPGFLLQDPPAEIIPFHYKGATPLISVNMGSLELRLTVDTGAEVNLIDKKYQHELDGYLQDFEQKDLGGFGRQAKSVTVANLSGARIGLLTGKPMRTAFVNLGQLNRFVPGYWADGIIGYELLRQFRIAFNFKKREMYLWDIAPGLLVSGK